MNRLVMMAVAAGAAMAAMAMPTRQQLAKAQEMVSDVTAADVAALKAGAKKPAEVAAKHMELAAQAGSEAEKYLLLQGAFHLYVKGEDYDNAAKAIETMQAEIKDFNPEVIVELCGKALVRKMQDNAPRLYAIKENARRIVFYRKQLPIREAAVKKNPRDQQAQRKLAECHAELGDWPKALEVFVKAGGEFKKMAEGETSGKVPAQELGDFWWDYETKSDTFVYKLHAAELYRKALADDSFKGLARTRADQRVKECEAVSVALQSAVSSIASKPANLPPVSLSRFDFRYAHDLHFHFNPCPAGTVKMNNISVTVTRPFCLGEKPITRREWFAVRGEIGTSWKGGEDAPMTYMTYQEASDFAEKLTNKFRKELPQGYVIRLPTAAEWLVAHQAGMPDDVSDRQAFQLGWFGQGCDGNAGSSNMRLYYKDKNLPIPMVKDIWPDFVVNKIGPKNEWKRYSSQIAPVPVGLKPADKLGLFDMMGNCFEMCYDRSKIIQGHSWNNEFVSPVRPYAEQGDNLVDPVDQSGDFPMMVSDYLTPRTNCRGITGIPPLGRTPFLGIRLCLGPDLVAEKKAKGAEVAGAENTEACYPREDFGGELLASKYEIVEHTGKMNYVRHLDRLFNCERVKRSVGDGFAFEVGAKEKEAGFTLALPEPVTLAGLLVVNRAEVCQERQVPLCVWASEDRVKWERIFIDESVRDEYRIDLSKKNITCKYLRFGRLPGVNNEPFHLARTLVYVKKDGKGIDQPGKSTPDSSWEWVIPTEAYERWKMTDVRPADDKWFTAEYVMSSEWSKVEREGRLPDGCKRRWMRTEVEWQGDIKKVEKAEFLCKVNDFATVWINGSKTFDRIGSFPERHKAMDITTGFKSAFSKRGYVPICVEITNPWGEGVGDFGIRVKMRK